MDYKQKYEQALEKAKKVYNRKDATNGGKLILESIFPELKESENNEEELTEFEKNLQIIISEASHWTSDDGSISTYCQFGDKEIKKISGQLLDLAKKELKESEDEKIRKGLIAIITDFESLYLQENYSLSREEALAWLEKQGEQIPCNGEVNDEALQQQLQIWFDKGKCSGRDEVIFHPENFGLQKQGEQKSEEVNNLHNYLYDEQKPADEVGNYDHKKVLQTIINEQKPAWSEEDEEMRIYACKFLDDAKQIDYSVPHKEDIDKCISWLKSLKERYTWKPSGEQIETLEQWLRDSRYKCYHIIDSLYQDLKKLREE